MSTLPFFDSDLISLCYVGRFSHGPDKLTYVVDHEANKVVWRSPGNVDFYVAYMGAFFSLEGKCIYVVIFHILS